MINASPTSPSAAAPTPTSNPFQPTAVGTPSAAPKPFTPPSTAPVPPVKKGPNLKLWAGLVATVVIAVGVLVGGYLALNQQDVRQQASLPIGGGDGCLQTQVSTADGKCGGSATGGCSNACQCGYSSGSCASKPLAATCYTGAQCASGNCQGGSPAGSGRQPGDAVAGSCSNGSAPNPECNAGWSETRPAEGSCGTGQGIADETQNGLSCHRCLAVESIPAGSMCQASQGCICSSGPDTGHTIARSASCQAENANGCWTFQNVVTSVTCIYRSDCSAVPANQRFSAEGTCRVALVTPETSPGTGGVGTPCRAGAQIIDYTQLYRGDNTVACTRSTPDDIAYQCAEGFSPVTDGVKYLCLASSYSPAKKQCIVTEFHVEDFYNTAVRACGSGGNGTWSDTACRCQTFDCNTACTDPLGCTCSTACVNTTADNHQTCGGFKSIGCLGTCTNSAGCTCDASCVKTSTTNGQTCGGYKVASSPGTGGTGLQCPNPPHLPAKHWVKFTCDKCQLTTENGVTDWRCYDHRQDSNTPLSLGPNDCGQVDVLSGPNDADYCGYETANYTCNQARCQPTSSPTPPASTPTQISCGGLQMLDETGATVLTQTPAVGTNVRFRCLAAGGVTPDYYFFTLRDNPLSALNLIYQGDSALTFPITLTPFTHLQCNPCLNGVCSSADSVNQNCNFQLGTIPTPTPPVGPQCLSISLNNASRPNAGTSDPRIGENISFTCGAVTGADHYEFRVALPDGTTQNLTATGRNSSNITITQSGMYAAQCRICTGPAATSCQEFEALPDTTAGTQ